MDTLDFFLSKFNELKTFIITFQLPVGTSSLDLVLFLKAVSLGFSIEWERLVISSRKLDTKGTFHAKMGSIKDRNNIDLTEVEILGRSGKNTQKSYTKEIFVTQITTKL